MTNNIIKRENIISGFIILKDAIRQGYPFIEAIVSALPICDEMLISEGYSTDGTWDALQRLFNKYPQKIKLFRDKWISPTNNHGELLARMSNILKNRCIGDYCFYIQANEIVHEEAVNEIIKLTVNYPEADMFSLPFYNIIGSKYLYQIDYRRRLFKNLKHVVLRGDATGVGYDSLWLLLHLKSFYKYLLYRYGEKIYYLNAPVYRYHSLFPLNYYEKVKTKLSLYQEKNHRETIVQTLKNIKDAMDKCKPGDSTIEQFWKKMIGCEFMSRDDNVISKTNTAKGIIRVLEKSPSVIRHLFDLWEYDLNKSIELLI